MRLRWSYEELEQVFRADVVAQVFTKRALVRGVSLSSFGRLEKGGSVPVDLWIDLGVSAHSLARRTEVVVSGRGRVVTFPPLDMRAGGAFKVRFLPAPRV